MGLFDKLFKSSTDEDRSVFMAGYRAGFPAASDESTPAGVNFNSRVYKRGLQHGQRDYQSTRQSVPQIFDENGKLIDDAGDEE